MGGKTERVPPYCISHAISKYHDELVPLLMIEFATGVLCRALLGLQLLGNFGQAEGLGKPQPLSFTAAGDGPASHPFWQLEFSTSGSQSC